MAWVNTYSDARGNSYPAAYFKLVSCQLNWSIQTADTLFHVYKDKPSRLANLLPVGNLQYILTSTANSDGKTFNTFFALNVIASGGLTNFYTYIMSRPENQGAIIDWSNNE